MGQISNQFRMIFLLFNISYFAVGVVMLGFGIYSVLNFQKYGSFTENLYLAGASIFIAVGVLKIVFSVVGVIAMFVKSRHLLFISDLASTACVMPPLSPNYMYVQYCWVLIVLMLFTFVAAIYGFITRPDAYYTTRDRVIGAYANNASFTTDIVNLQSRLNCCGVDGLPGINNCSSSRNATELFGQGCTVQLVNVIQNDLYNVGALGMAFGVYEISSFLIAMQNLEGL